MNKEKQVRPANPLAEVIGSELERAHAVPQDDVHLYVGYKSVVLCFGNGKSVHLDVELHTCRNGCFPVIRIRDGDWKMLEAAPEELPITDQYPPMPEVKTPRGVGKLDLSMIEGSLAARPPEYRRGTREKDTTSNVKKYLSLLRDAPEAITKLDIRFARAKQELEESRGEIAKNSLRLNPVACVRGERIRNRNGVLAYAPQHEEDGKIILDSIRFTLGSEQPLVLVSWCNKDGNICTSSMQIQRIEGQVSSNGVYMFSATYGVDIIADDLRVDYDYEYNTEDYKIG